MVLRALLPSDYQPQMLESSKGEGFSIRLAPATNAGTIFGEGNATFSSKVFEGGVSQPQKVDHFYGFSLDVLLQAALGRFSS